MAGRSRSRRRSPKTISPQGITGQQGINLIERVVLEMGSRWTPSGPNEIGIDGYIELFDPNSCLPLHLTVAVQSKVVTAIAGDSNSTFDYWCDANDVDVLDEWKHAGHSGRVEPYIERMLLDLRPARLPPLSVLM